MSGPGKNAAEAEVEGLEADIARTLGVSAGAVKTRAHRGLAAVRTALGAGREAPRG